MRLLDSTKIEYEYREFTVEGDNYAGIGVAEKFGMSADEVFKTLVTHGDKNGINVFCVPINCELDLKKAAKASQNKKIEMISVNDILSITGYIRGGRSPVGMKKKYPTFIDETAILFDKIGVSAGARGCEIVINPEELRRFIDGVFVDLT